LSKLHKDWRKLRGARGIRTATVHLHLRVESTARTSAALLQARRDDPDRAPLIIRPVRIKSFCCSIKQPTFPTRGVIARAPVTSNLVVCSSNVRDINAGGRLRAKKRTSGKCFNKYRMIFDRNLLYCRMRWNITQRSRGEFSKG